MLHMLCMDGSDYIPTQSARSLERCNLPNMRHPRKNRLQLFLAAQLGLIRNETDPNKIRKYSDFIDYYADLTEQEVIEYQKHYQTKEGDIMGMVKIWTEQGLQKGIEQGLQQGEKIGEKKECIALLTRQLRRKFGLQPTLEAALQQLPNMEVEKLEDLADALLDFTEIKDLENWLGL